MKSELGNIEHNIYQSTMPKPLCWHDKLRLQTKTLNPSGQSNPSNMITYAHNKGTRKTIQFEQKPFYTFEEMLLVINLIDDAWETSTESQNDMCTYVH
jgi:hypothetical protein